MREDVSRTIIELLVRRALAEIRDTPGRSTRNLVDLALNFAEGRFQSRFFQSAQTMLKNEDSAYYQLIPDIVANVDTERLVCFGMNLGYNSCTLGAKKIRKIEQQEHFNIPWSLTLAMSGKAYAAQEAAYHAVLEQGAALGIYTWMIYALDGLAQLLALAASYPDCAFVLFCAPDAISAGVLDRARGVNNVMFAVAHLAGVGQACRLLRARKQLYSVFHLYGAADLEGILSGDRIRDTGRLHPAFTAFLSTLDCPEAVQEAVYQYVTSTRNGQNCPSVLWDTIHDSRMVDAIISDGACSAGFDPEGNLYVFRRQPQRLEYNLFRQPLDEILKRVFPKAVCSATA